MNDKSRSGKERSPNFPYIPLATALERARQFYDGEKRAMAPYPVAVTYWKLAPSSSAALQTVGALKSYGLLADEGSGSGRKVRLTDLALRILLDQRPESAERLEFMRQAARSPTVAGQVYSSYPDALPSMANLIHYLVFDLKFSATTAPKAAAIIFKNHELTAMDESPSESDGSDIDGDTDSDATLAPMTLTSRIEAATRPSRFGMPSEPVRPVQPAVSGGEEIANIRVSRACTIRLLATGPYSRQSIESLVKQLQLGLELGNFDEGTEDRPYDA